MSTSQTDSVLAGKSVLVVGVGGLGCPAALALVRSGLGRLLLADDDEVELSNLHRQILFRDEQLGRDKLDAARESLEALGDGRTQIELVRERLLPDNALSFVERADVIVEGADNFATKCLAADAAHLARRPVVHGAGVRWTATAWCVAPEGAPCYRCLFEDVPTGAAVPNCAEAGVMGPVVGVCGALMADLALRLLAGETPFGTIHTFDGKTDRLRSVAVAARGDCPLCGSSPKIFDIIESRYIQGICAA